jgi:6-phosphofructo-2-kinase
MYKALELKNEFGPKLVLFMVGLPARGKSYIAKKLKRYLSWLGYHTRVFNVGNYRRELVADQKYSVTAHSFRFFDPTNEAAAEYRDQVDR